MLTEEIDVVYTWVDGKAPGFLAARERHTLPGQSAAADESCSASRFRNNAELRFSLRSVERNAPWVRMIHIVTNGQVPDWLLATPRVSVVTHNQIFSCRDVLPVFNSHAIELQLHRIPHLSRRFLYLNDDLFICRPIHPEDFIIDHNAQSFYLDTIPLHSNSAEGNIHDRAYAHTQEVVAGAGFQATPHPRWLPCHCPQLYDKDILFRLEKQYSEAYSSTLSHRFRHPRDFVLRIAYLMTLHHESETTCSHRFRTLNARSDYMLLMLSDNLRNNASGLLAAARSRPRFLCLNDDILDSGKGRITGLWSRLMLHWLFPRPSRFERAPDHGLFTALRRHYLSNSGRQTRK
jgi:hypothetical protein